MTAVDAAAVIVDLLQQGHAVEFRVRGDSMYPAIREDDLVHVEPSRDVAVEEVALVLATRGLTAHRVIAVHDGVVTMRGDNAPAADDPLPAEQVLGKVTWRERGGKRRSVKRSWLSRLRSR